jgi:dienelactone hydrolase
VIFAFCLGMLAAADGGLAARVLRLGVVAAVAVAAGWSWLRSSRLGGLVEVVLGTVGLVAGIGIGLRSLIVVGPGWRGLVGLVMLVSAMALLAAGFAGLMATRSVPIRLLIGIPLILAVTVATWILTPAVIATNVPEIVPGEGTPADFGFYADEIRFGTADGVEVWAWYAPPTSGKVVVLRHGAGATASSVLGHARMLVGHGYGVLITDARGHGHSGGRAMDFGWHGNTDLRAAIDFLVAQPEVDPSRMAVVGMSMGGEEAIGAIGADYRIAAVVAEGATARTDADKAWLAEAYGLRGRIQMGLEWAQYTVTDLLTDASKPQSLASAARDAAPRPILLVTAGEMPDEANAAAYLRAVAGDHVSIWTVPGAGHTQGLDTAPEEWERIVLGFLDGLFD